MLMPAKRSLPALAGGEFGAHVPELEGAEEVLDGELVDVDELECELELELEDAELELEDDDEGGSELEVALCVPGRHCE